MQKVVLMYKTPVAKINKEGKPEIVYDTKEETYLVASTKSYNNLIDDLKLQNKIAQNAVRTDVFLDIEIVRNEIELMVKSQIEDEEITESFIDAIMKALDGACVFEKPKVSRKKTDAEPVEKKA